MKNKAEVPPCEHCAHRKNHISAFSHLKDDEVANVSANKGCLFYKKGKVVFHEGNRPNGVYCLHSGKLKLYKLGIEGKEQIIRFVKPGDVIGYRSLLSDENLSVSGAALEDTACCFIPKSVLFDVIQKNPKFSMDLMKRACQDLGEATKLITNLAQKTVRERLAEVLLILKSNFGIDEKGILQISLTREELANMTGTATESVIRLLSEFKEDGYVALEGRKIKLLDIPGLIRVGNVYD
jgi:CRP-like cAMP-binding protein